MPTRLAATSLVLLATLAAAPDAPLETAAEERERLRHHKRILIFGPPGVGKGTQSAQLVQRYGVCHVSTGDMLRAEAASKDSELGRRAKKLMAMGELVPDWVVISMVQKRLRRDRDCRRHGWLLDGFPRTARQAHALLDAGLVPHHIVILNASTTTLLERMDARKRAAIARGEAPRADDNVATMRRRLFEYERNKEATLRALRRYLNIDSIDGGASVANVAGAIGTALGVPGGVSSAPAQQPAAAAAAIGAASDLVPD